MHEFVFDQWCFLANVLAQEYGLLQVASKSKESMFVSLPSKPKLRSSSIQSKGNCTIKVYICFIEVKHKFDKG
jgi:hypothetical protein